MRKFANKTQEKTAENREKIKDQSEAIKAINQSLKNSKIKDRKNYRDCGIFTGARE